MAKFDYQGYCPASALQQRAMQSGNPIAQRVLCELGARIDSMVYPYERMPKEEALVLRLMETDLGLRVVGVLRKLIPECDYPDFGRKIEIRDVDNFYEIMYNGILADGNFYVLLMDDHFYVDIVEEGEKVVIQIMARRNA